MNKNYTIKLGGKVVGNLNVSGDRTYRATLSKVKKGTRFFVEAAEDGKPLIAIRSSVDDEAQWDTEIANFDRIKRIATKSNQSISLGTFGEIVAGFESTKIARLTGERDELLELRANTSDAKITIGTHKPGKIIVLEAGEMPILVRKGGFMFAQEGVIIDNYTITGNKAALYTKIFGSSYLQRISGDGLFCLEIQESCPDEPTVLFPGETITVEARRIIAMSESISILDAWKVSDKKTIRESEGTDYGLVLKANICGGLIYISDFSQTPPPTRKKK